MRGLPHSCPIAATPYMILPNALDCFPWMLPEAQQGADGLLRPSPERTCRPHRAPRRHPIQAPFPTKSAVAYRGGEAMIFPVTRQLTKGSGFPKPSPVHASLLPTPACAVASEAAVQTSRSIPEASCLSLNTPSAVPAHPACSLGFSHPPATARVVLPYRRHPVC